MASGEGKRFSSKKGGKLLAPLGGIPVLKRVLQALPIEEFCDIVVVTRWTEVETMCNTMQIKCVRHDNPLRSDTIREGMRAVIDGAADPSAMPDACLFVAGDQPLLTADSIKRLLQTFRDVFGRGQSAVCRLCWKQEAGNPVLFPAAMFEKLRSLEGNRGGASLLREEDRKSKGIQDKGIQDEGIQVLIVEAGSPYELMDVDSPEDLAELDLYFAKIEK
jgi:CTP:molybdopterin cytidylyltransferase MocA